MGRAKAKRPRNKGDRERSAVTLHGAIRVTRRYQLGRDGVGEFPLDKHLGLDKHGVSPGAREVATRLGMENSFAQAAADAKRYVGVTVGREFLRGIVEREGERVTVARDGGTLPAAFTAKDAVVDPKRDAGLSRMYVGVDGVMAPMVGVQEKEKRRAKSLARRSELEKVGKTFAQPLPPLIAGYKDRYKEMKLVTFYTQNKDRLHVAVTSGDCHEAATLMTIHAGQVKFREATERISLTDGAVWIMRRLSEEFPWLDAMLLDCLHLAQHVHAAAVCLRGDTPEAGDWTKARISEFRAMSVADALGSITAARKEATTTAARGALDNLSNYVRERAAMLGYRQAEAKGWDIGSGPTEAQCKTTTKRVKISGAKWNIENAPRMMNLAAMRNSGQWDAYWARLAA